MKLLTGFGSIDVDDLIINTLGGIVGYSPAFYGIKKLVSKGASIHEVFPV
jgi:glycopeptide antibiotics resistance protein